MSESTLKPFNDKLDDNTDTKQQPALKPFTGALDGEEKGVKGHLQDTGASLMSGIAGAAEAATVGIADLYTEGRVGRDIDNTGYYKLGAAQKHWSDKKTDIAKEQDKTRQNIDGIWGKTKYVLENPSQLTNALAESLPYMAGGAALGRVSKIANPVAASAVGEGAVMAGSQAESIRQQSDDQLLNNGQEAAAFGTGALGSLFGFAGGRIAQKMGLADIDTAMQTGRLTTQQVGEEIAKIPAKDIPLAVVKGAISEGFLEELPQTVSEQVIQNLALDKAWHDGLDDAIVMGTLSGMAMGGGASGVGKALDWYNQPSNENGTPDSAVGQNPMLPAPNGGSGGGGVKGEYIPRENSPEQPNQGRTNFEYDQFSTDADNLLASGTGYNPTQPSAPENPDSPIAPTTPPLSRQLGINPNDGPLSSAAALAVDSGASPVTPQLGYTPEQQTQEQSNTPISDAVPSNYQSLLGSQNDGQPFDARFEDATVQQGNTQADNTGKSISQQYDANAADAMGGGIETDRAKTTTAQTVQPILGQDGQNKWFGSQDKAQAFIDKKNLGNDYQVVQDGKRFEIQPKPKAQDDAYFQSKLDDLDKQRAAFEAVGDDANAIKLYGEMQKVSREWQTNSNTDTPTTTRAEPSKGASDNAWGDFYRKNRNMISEELFMGGHQDRNTLEESTPEIQSRHAHGMAKATPAASVRDLKDILENGIDQNRGQGRLFTAPLSQGKLTAEQRSAMSQSGTSSGSAYSDGAFTLIAKRGVGDIRSVSEIDAVMVNSAVPQEVVNGLRQDFPNMKFGYANEMTALLSGGKQSNNVQVASQLTEHKQQFADAKTVPQKAKLRKQIDQLKTEQDTEAATQWQGMSPEQRQQVIEQVDTTPTLKAKLVTAHWENIGDGIKPKVTAAIVLSNTLNRQGNNIELLQSDVNNIATVQAGNATPNAINATHPLQQYDDVARQYGRSVSPDGMILRSDGKSTNVRIVEKKNGVQLVDVNGKQVGTARDADGVGVFIEKSWGDKKSAQNRANATVMSPQEVDVKPTSHESSTKQWGNMPHEQRKQSSNTGDGEKTSNGVLSRTDTETTTTVQGIPTEVTRGQNNDGNARIDGASVSTDTEKSDKITHVESKQPIQDLGEKIGGARKDTALSTSRSKKAKSTDDRPTWAKRYTISEIVSSSNQKEVGKWVIEDIKKTDWKGKPKQLGTFDSEQEAQDMLPVIAVGLKHRVYARRVSEGGFEIWRQINDSKRVKVVNQVFETKEAAQTYLIKNAIDILETNTTFGELDLPRPENTVRQGIERRNGDAKDTDFMDVFGFRGVEFGNWNNQEDRQQLLNDAYDGLLDLADVLKIPAKAISLNGDLALAFGARGQGLSSARAHYEPAKVVINLTKMNGAGSLAHEWWHAFDHYLARQDGKASAEWVVDADGTRSLKISNNSKDRMVSHGFSHRNSGVREDVREVYKALMQTMTTKAEQYVQDTATVDDFVGRTKNEITQKLESIRQDLSRQLDPKYYKRHNKPASAEKLAEFDTLAQQIINGEHLETEARYDEAKRSSRNVFAGARWTNDALDKISAIYKAVRGRSGFNSEQKGPLDRLRASMSSYASRLKMLADAQKGEAKTKKVPTEFAMDAKRLDEGRASDYWTTPHEMSARAFQGFVEDKIAAQAGKSPFLNYAPENKGVNTPWGWVRPYPHGSERKAINEKFDVLVDTLKTEETDTGIRLFSRNKLKPDSERSGTSPMDTTFKPLSVVGATRRAVDFLNKFKLSTTVDAAASGNIRVSLDSGVNEVGNMDGDGFTVQVVADFDGLPAAIQQDATYTDENGDSQNYEVSGVWHNRTLYVVADAVQGDSAKQLTTFDAYEELLAHEIVGHFGVQRLFGDEYKTKLQALFNSLGGLKGIRKIAKDNGVDVQQFESAYIQPRLQAAKDGIYTEADVQQSLVGELFAFVEQNAKTKPFVRQKLKEVIGYVRQWLREHGFAKFLAKHNDADVMMFLAEARKGLLNPTAKIKYSKAQFGRNGDNVPLFSRKTSTETAEVAQVRKQFENTPQWMKAPNGNPTNLTEQQWLQVRTPSFKQWFGDWEVDAANASKVIDANGEPLVVYHGTKADFNEFDINEAGSNNDTGMWGTGFYFSPIKKMSRGYGDKLKKVYLSLQNPLIIEGGNGNVPKGLMRGLSITTHGTEGKLFSDTFRERLLDAGYDGVLHYSSTDKGFKLAQIVAFNPDQIKSATDNVGTFDSSNADIRFSQQSTESTEVITTQQVRETLVERFGKDTIAKLEQQGRLEILDTTPRHIKEKGIEGYFENGKAVLIADNLSADTIIPTLLHELGGHGGFQGMMKPEQYADLMRQFDRLVAQGNPIALEAKQLAERETGANVQQLEYLPYLLTLASNTNVKNAIHKSNVKRLISDLIAQVKAWIYDRLGVNLNLTPDDMVALAERMVSNATKQSNDSLLTKPSAPAAPAFSSKFKDPVLQLWDALAKGDKVFKTPVSESKDVMQIFAELEGERGFTISEGNQKNAAAVLLAPGEYDKLWVVLTPQNKKAYVIQKGKEVWVDVARLKQGGDGSRVYNAVANYAFNNDLVFIADPVGISDVAMTRRLENMISSALKFGTTKHLQPHFMQLDGNDDVDGIDWRDGDDEHNLKEMIMASHAATLKHFPELKNVTYNAEKDVFERINEDLSGRDQHNSRHAESNEFTGRDFQRLAKVSRGLQDGRRNGFTPSAGRTTLERTVLTGTFLRGTSEQARNTLLARFGVLGSERLSDENAVLYSRADLSGSINRLSKSFKQASAQSTNQWLKNKAKDTLGIALQALTRRQIMEVYGKLLPQLSRYNHIVELMDADATETSVNADNIVNEWADLKDEQQLAELMHEATLAKIDPAKPFVSGSGTSISKYAQLRKGYDALTPEAQAMYVKARDAYSKHYADVHQAIKERILRSELSNQKKTDLLKQMDDNFFAQSKGVYFPLSRFGKYVVVVRDANGVVESVNRAETLNEAEAVRSELQKQFPNSKVSAVTKDKEFNASRDGVGRGFMSELFKEAGNLGLSAKDQADFEDTLSQLYLASMPDLSWAKHGIHRKGMAGFSQDARRAFAQNMLHGGSYLAKLRYGDQLAEQLDSMKKTVEKEIDTNPDFDQVTARNVYEEMEKRHENYMNPKPHPVSTALTSLGFVYYLGISPAAAMVNLSQTALVAYPLMGAKFGFKESAAALKTAMADFAKGVDVKNRNLDITKSLNTDEKKAYEEALRRGVIDKTQVHSLAGVAQGEDGGLSEKLKPIMKWSSFMFHHAERFNREVTFVAAYRLAKEHSIVENGKPRKLTNDEALEMAIDMTYKGHFDYSAGNRARIMQGNVAKVVLLFKQFAQNMIFTLMRQAYLSMYGMDVNERNEARKALTAILAFHGLAAGLLGLPIATSLVAASFLIAKKNPMLGMLFGAGAAAVFFGAGGDDDDPWDLEVEIRNYAAEVLGDDAANYLFKGAPRALGIDLSGRVGLDNLVIPKVQDGLEGQNLSNSIMAGALGPVAGIGANLFKGAQELGDGNLSRGFEAMLPVVIKNPIKSVRYYNEGVQDKTGIPIQDEVDAWGVFNQTIGFSPADVRLAYEGRSAIYQKQNRLKDRRTELMSQWSRARKQDDQEEMDAKWEEIKLFNEKNPKIRINHAQLMQSYRQRENRVNKSENGIYVAKKYEDSREAGAFAFGE